MINNQYKIIERIGGGRFGEIFLSQNIGTKQNYALKLEAKNSKHQQLMHEAKIYQVLEYNMIVDQFQQQFNPPGIPKIQSFGQDGDYNFLILELLGDSLDNLFLLCDKKFSLKTVLYLADQLILLLEFIHSKGVIHQNLKPSDIMFGILDKQELTTILNNHKLYLIDFGLAKKHILDEENQKSDFQNKQNQKLTKITQFSSINSHLGKEQGRRDDLESLGYILIYFLRGTLPWIDFKKNQLNSSYQQMVDKKVATTIENLCHDLPKEFSLYFAYIKNLGINDIPDYKHLRQLFIDLYQKMKFIQNYIFDWHDLQIIPENL